MGDVCDRHNIPEAPGSSNGNERTHSICRGICVFVDIAEFQQVSSPAENAFLWCKHCGRRGAIKPECSLEALSDAVYIHGGHGKEETLFCLIEEEGCDWAYSDEVERITSLEEGKYKWCKRCGRRGAPLVNEPPHCWPPASEQGTQLGGAWVNWEGISRFIGKPVEEVKQMKLKGTSILMSPEEGIFAPYIPQGISEGPKTFIKPSGPPISFENPMGDPHGVHPAWPSTTQQILEAHMGMRAMSEPLGFQEPEDGSQGRYERRQKKVPWSTHTFYWVIHNAIAHPLIAFVPVKFAFDFHDWTSRKMHGK